MPHRPPFPYTKSYIKDELNYKVFISESQYLGFKIIRKDTGESIMDTSKCKIVYNKN